MRRSRLEAFSDGVIAIIITIMVLEIRVPHGADLSALRPVVPVFLTYAMSFVYLAIYWNNHHHMFHLVEQVGGAVLWANAHLLFWLSLVPFATGWMGENHFEPMPTALYGLVLLMAALAYYILQGTIIRQQGPHSPLKLAIGRDWKGKASLILYVAAIGIAALIQWISIAIFIFVALMWIVPDRRIENAVGRSR